LFAGAAALAIIGLFHPVVIKVEYHFGKGAWPVFLLAGLLLIAAACAVAQPCLSALLGITGFTCLWTIKELFDQEKRVRRGWFPRKPSPSPEENPSRLLL
jgi:ammonia channel protein AmtB